ncbi:MAG: DUF3344 domain-containing protein [Candidatus Syntrophoarchaeum sp.]|nr:DUF3344 domain-containing protein [Candidatus Syntrophoarchaeum sp.]
MKNMRTRMGYRCASMSLLFLILLCGVSLAVSPAGAADAEPAVIDIGSFTTYVGSNVTVPVEIINATDIAGGSVNISFNPSIVNVQEALPGDFGTPIANIDNSAGFVDIASAATEAVGKENASLATVRFKGIAKGLTTLNITSAYLSDETGYNISYPETFNGSINVCTPLVMNIASYDVCVGSNVTVPIEITNAADIAGGSAKIVFNASIVNVQAVTPGHFGVNTTANIDNTNGSVHVAVANATAVGIEEAVLANFSFKGLSEGFTALGIQNAILNDEDGNVIIPETSDGTVDVIEELDLTVTEVNAYHYAEGSTLWETSSKLYPAWFNLTNYVDVTVKNNGTADADAFNVSLYADGEFIGEQLISNLSGSSNETLVFEWNPIGIDEQDGGLPHTYSMLAEADPHDTISESDETNNNMTVSETVKWNGYMADEPLNTFAHGTLRGGLLFTTGDGYYSGAKGPGVVETVHYNVDIPQTSSVELARLNVYYTWFKQMGEPNPYPKMRVEITNETGTYDVALETAYNDRIGSLSGWDLPWGNYVYNLSDYITGNGSYTVTIYNNGTGYQSFAIASPGLEVIYRDDSMPQIEYWLAEGADILIGGRRSDSGSFLALAECINNATFEGSIDLSRVKNATLGVVSPWGESWDSINVLYFNGIEIGRSVYDILSGDISLDGIRMTGTGYDPQVGVNLSDVTGYLDASVNIAGQGDNSDCMMPANAFLVVEYEEEEFFDTRSPANPYPSITGTHNGTIRPSHDVYVSKMYTYACTGTGGHTEYVRIWNESVEPIAEGHWTGYAGSSYHNITFDTTFTLFADHTYNYTIRTGSYPQIHHTPALHTDDGWINCTEFTDANGRRYDNWIPAIRLESGT